MAKYKGNYKKGELVRVDAYTQFPGKIVKLTGDFEYQIKDLETGLTDKNFDYAESCLKPMSFHERIKYME